MLIANPEINLMYAANEGGTAGAVNAVIAADQVGKTYVMGTDTTTELVEMVQQGDVLLQLILSSLKKWELAQWSMLLKLLMEKKSGNLLN